MVSSTGPAGAQTTIPHDVVAPGGISGDGSLALYSVVGQPAAGEVGGTSNRNQIGYVYVAKDFLRGIKTSVAVTSFGAALAGKLVRLEWTVGHADGLRGFNIYRAATGEGDFRLVGTQRVSGGGEFAYHDDDVLPGTTYRYRLGAVDRDGEFLSPTRTVTTPEWPTELRQNHPNPFNPTTTISFYLSQASPVRVSIYDVNGRLVATVLDEVLPPGNHEAQWQGLNNRREPAASGVYFYRLAAGRERLTRKMTLVK